MIGRVLAVGFLGIASCAGPGEAPRIVIERIDEASWRAIVRPGREVGYLRFQRQADFYREDVWRVATDGWRLDRDGEDQVLVAEAGAETDRVVVEFPVHVENIAKEYEFFLPFTDGSLALYTGHFYITTSRPDEPDPESPFLRSIEVTPLPGERLVVQGEVVEAGMVWTDPHGDGTYVYFGNIEPVETADMVGIIDPGAPAWIVDRLHETLPAIFSLYADGFGKRLPWKPVVLMSFDAREAPGLFSGGGTLNGLVQMTARGNDWREETPDSLEHLHGLIAHEAAHFWNGQLHTSEAMEESWMHEGSADAFSAIAMRHLGLIDAHRLAERRTEALNRCAFGLADGPLAESSRRGQFGNYYSCGEMIASWSVASLPGDAEPERLFEIWRAVFERSDPEDGRYDSETYFEALLSLGADPESIERLRALIEDPQPDPSRALADLMSSAGVAVEVLDRPPGSMRRELAAGALGHLMAGACDGRFSYDREGSLLRTRPIEDCEPFTRSIAVVSIEGEAVGTDGDRAFEAARGRCERGEPVRLGLQGGSSVGVTCAGPLSPAPAALAFPLQE